MAVVTGKCATSYDKCNTSNETGKEVAGSCPTLDRPNDKIDTHPPYKHSIKPIKIGDVTEEVVSGQGVFDIYMRAGMNQLMTQYEAGRIKGPDFTAAYIAQIELMMTQANQFVLSTKQMEMEVKLFELKYNDMLFETAAKKVSIEKMKFEKDLIVQQIAKTDAEVKATCQQTAEMKANGLEERKFKSVQSKKTEEETIHTCQQTKKTNEERILVCQQTAELKANGDVERALKGAQRQTQVKQAELYNRQITGYDEKNRNENAKNLLDAWAVQAVEEPDGSYKITQLDGVGAGGVVNKMKSGSGL